MRTSRVSLIAVGVLGLIQLVPVERSNPAPEEEVPAPPAVRAILERSCYDCHSHATRWPWYSRLAPISWLLAYDVAEAREHMNFSTWNRYSAKKRADKLEECWEHVRDGEMPLWYYLPAHPAARLDDADRAALRTWALGSDASG